MSTCSVHIVATPWNFLNSFVFALERKDEKSYLLYVDFPENQENPYLQALEQLENSPFQQFWCFHGKYKSVWNKWRKRLVEIQKIQEIVAQLKPDQVFVGSDRRIEFQCAMTEAVKHKPQVKGIYLDEGVFSYTCRKRSQTWRDRVLDSWIKRLMYPCDWKHPITIGASDWISEGWLLAPEKACGLLKDSLLLNPIPLSFYQSPRLQSLLEQFISDDQALLLNQAYDLLIILPHPSNLSVSLQQQYAEYLSRQTGLRIAVKKHPRDGSNLNWLENVLMRDKRMSFSILPSALPLELILPKLSFSDVVSAPSTALLTVKLLKKDVGVNILTDEAEVHHSEFEELLS